MSESGQPIHFHITGFTPSEPPNAGKSIIAAIYNDFMKVLNDFKKGIGHNTKQLQQLNKLSKGVTEVMKYVNEISNPTISTASVVQGIQSSTSALGTDIQGITGSGLSAQYKANLEAQFKRIEALLSSNVTLTAIVNLGKDIAKMHQWFEKEIKKYGGELPPDLGKLVGTFIESIVTPIEDDLKTIKNLPKKWEELFPGQPVPSSLKTAYQKSIDELNRMTEIKSWDNGESQSDTLSHLIHWGTPDINDVQLQVFFKNFFLAGGHDRRGEVGVSGWSKASARMVSYSKQLEKGLTVQMSPEEIVESIRKMITAKVDVATEVQSLFSGLWDRYTNARSNISGMLNGVTGLSSQTITNTFSALAAMTSVVKTLTETINIPINLVNQEQRQILKGTRPYGG